MERTRSRQWLRANTTTAVAVSVRDHMRQLCEGKNWTLASNDEGVNDESY